jgi:hypothetical protein
MGAIIHIGRSTWRWTAATAVILLAALGLQLPAAAGGALAAAPPGTSFSAGGPTCAIEAGKAYCWAQGSLPVAVNTRGALNGKTLTQISTAFDYACALDTSGSAYCWGSNQVGQLGFGVLGFSDLPVPVHARGVLAGKRLVQISAGQEEACALDSAGHAYCWGLNTSGELGDGSTSNSAVPPVAVDTSGVLAGKTLTQISTGFDVTCALDSTGAAYCWGNNHYGQLGDNSRTASAVPVAVDTGGALAGKTLAQIDASTDWFFACAMSTSGAVYCWGALTSGSAGSTVPVEAGPSPVTGVTAAEGTRSAKVSWQVPVMSAGVTGYTAIANPGEKICLTKTTSCTIGGLKNDITYSVTVVAHTATTNTSASVPVAVTPGSKVAFTSIPFATVAFGGNGFRFTVSATGGSPAPAITLKGTLPQGMTFTRLPGGLYTLTGNPDQDHSGADHHGAVGLYHLTFTAKSKAGIATQAFTLTVGRSPTLGKLPSVLTLKAHQFVKIPITTIGYPPAQLLKTGQLPSALPLEDHGNGTGLISGIVGQRDKPGRYQLTVIAASTTGEATHTITAILVQAPAVTSPKSAKVAIGNTIAFHVTASGFPGPKITESGRLPKGVTFNSATATLKGIPRSGTKGSYKITFTAANSAGKVKQAFTLTVT